MSEITERIEEVTLSLKSTNNFLEEHTKDYKRLLSRVQFLQDRNVYFRNSGKLYRKKIKLMEETIRKKDEKIEELYKKLIAASQPPDGRHGRW